MTDHPDRISRERAKELIDEHQTGTLILASLEPKQVIGDVPVGEREYVATMETYQFGTLEASTDE